MPKREDIHKILIIGSGPIIISQAAEFDYSCTQACKALREEGYYVVLVNSNPATIMTDPQMADKVYIEPLTVEFVEKVIEREKPDAILATLGGQVALNLAVALHERGLLNDIQLIGANIQAIKKAENRQCFKEEMQKIGIPVPRSIYATSYEQAKAAVATLGYPVVLRPSFTLGGTGGATIYNAQEFEKYIHIAFDLSIVHGVLIEEALIGYKEYELELMRDRLDNVIVICSIENFDALGIHTGDSITVAPAMTLTDKEYQRMRDMAIAIIRQIGIECGGSNIQFAVEPNDGRIYAIEINPRVSRSSALASKATGFPISKIAAKLAVGYTLDELPNEITKKTKAAFEPALDYVVVKIPKFDFEKFPGADRRLGTQMKSTGEVMAIGRTFKEALQKALRSLEDSNYSVDDESIVEVLTAPYPERIEYLKRSLAIDYSPQQLYELTHIDKWFLYQLQELSELEKELKKYTKDTISPQLLRQAKQFGFSDKTIAELLSTDELTIREKRKALNILPTYKLVDTCACEFASYTPYYYSTYEAEDEVIKDGRPQVIILGSGPNRIGQGIEFDYCCVHATFALKELGYSVIMVNSNPETVSTDYDTATKLYFEPITAEDVLNIIDREDIIGVILQFGGQTPLKLAKVLGHYNVPILGTPIDSIDICESRDRFAQLVSQLGINIAPYIIAYDEEQVIKATKKLGFPVLVRPSYVLGGQAIAIIYGEKELVKYVRQATKASPHHPIVVDKFLEDALEFEVDAISDGESVVICGLMEHIEEAGIHSGDSACVIPVRTKGPHIQTIIEYTEKIALALKVKGLINIQYALKDNQVYILEVNPRASRTVPFVSKATGIPWAKLAAYVIMDRPLKEVLQAFPKGKEMNYVAVKEAILPFSRFYGVDPVLGPQMRSTGEVMGISDSFGKSFAKSQIAANMPLPTEGTVLLSVNDKDKPQLLEIAKRLVNLNSYKIVATRGTAKFLASFGIPCKVVNKVGEGRPDIVDLIKNRQLALIINTPLGRKSKYDEKAIRCAAVNYRVPYMTTITAAAATIEALYAIKTSSLEVAPITSYYQ